jgi:hypothetical protein
MAVQAALTDDERQVLLQPLAHRRRWADAHHHQSARRQRGGLGAAATAGPVVLQLLGLVQLRAGANFKLNVTATPSAHAQVPWR